MLIRLYLTFIIVSYALVFSMLVLAFVVTPRASILLHYNALFCLCLLESTTYGAVINVPFFPFPLCNSSKDEDIAAEEDEGDIERDDDSEEEEEEEAPQKKGRARKRQTPSKAPKKTAEPTKRSAKKRKADEAPKKKTPAKSRRTSSRSTAEQTLSQSLRHSTAFRPLLSHFSPSLPLFLSSFLFSLISFSPSLRMYLSFAHFSLFFVFLYFLLVPLFSVSCRHGLET